LPLGSWSFYSKKRGRKKSVKIQWDSLSRERKKVVVILYTLSMVLEVVVKGKWKDKLGIGEAHKEGE
jgi:hypothetical protein